MVVHFFNRSLFICGLGLEWSKVFLRWLLIERARYFRRLSDKKCKGWFLINKDEQINFGKKFFLESVGFEIIEMNNYEEMYEDIWE